MNKIKTYNLFLESLSDDISDFIQDIHLKDNDVKCTFQLQNDDKRLVIYINSVYWNDSFRIGDIEYEVLSLINFLQSIGFKILSAKYRRGMWKTLFDDKPNRWGVKSDPKYIFDVQTDGYDFKDTKIDSFELIFEKI